MSFPTVSGRAADRPAEDALATGGVLPNQRGSGPVVGGTRDADKLERARPVRVADNGFGATVKSLMDGLSVPGAAQPAAVQPRAGLDVTARTELPINLPGSLQNAAWSPDGKSIAFTHFRAGYNGSPADLYVYNVETRELTKLLADGHANISQPGSTWTRDGKSIVFSSDRDDRHDEIYMIKADGSQREPSQITHSGYAAYEPSLSPDANAVAYEAHHVDEKGNGRIATREIGPNGATRYITSEERDCRQPNWSPRGDKIVFQRADGGSWNLWTHDVRTGEQKQVTTGREATDATFSPDGREILYSRAVPGGHARLFAIPTDGGRERPITSTDAYDGAASWSPDGRYVVMESSAGDPNGHRTKLVIAPVPPAP